MHMDLTGPILTGTFCFLLMSCYCSILRPDELILCLSDFILKPIDLAHSHICQKFSVEETFPARKGNQKSISTCDCNMAYSLADKR